MNRMGSPQSYGISCKGFFMVIMEEALRRKPANYAHWRNSNNCIRCNSLVILAAKLRPGWPGWVNRESEFMLLSGKA
jgi:hypothetical protein